MELPNTTGCGHQSAGAGTGSEIRAWKASLERELELVASVFEGRFGFRFERDLNFVGPPVGTASSRGDLPQPLLDLYAEVGEISLPDIGNGLFVHSSRWILGAADEYVPTSVGESAGWPACVFGSDGGGNLLALNRATGEIFFLPHAQVESRVYRPGRLPPVRIAGCLPEFLGLVTAFVANFAAGTGPSDFCHLAM